MKKYYIDDIGEVEIEECLLNTLSKKIEIIFFGNKKSIKVDFDMEDGNSIRITEVQKRIYFELINNIENVVSKLEEKIYDYYVNYVCKYTEYIDPWIIDKLPEINTINDMSKIVDAPDFVIELQSEEEEHHVYAILGCMWDEQYGLAVWLKHNEIYQIGNGAEVL